MRVRTLLKSNTSGAEVEDEFDLDMLRDDVANIFKSMPTVNRVEIEWAADTITFWRIDD